MARFMSFYKVSQTRPGKLCLQCIQNFLYIDEMHLPRSKAEGAVEITGDNDFKAHRAQDADVVVLNIPCFMYNTGDRDASWSRPADRGWKLGLGCGSLSLLLSTPDLFFYAPQSVKTLPCLSTLLSFSLSFLVGVLRAWCGIMPACIIDLVTNYTE